MKNRFFSLVAALFIILPFFFYPKGLCQETNQAKPTLERPQDITPAEWNRGGGMYFIGRLFIVPGPAQAPQQDRLLLKTRIGFQILLSGGIEEELKQKIGELGNKEINLCTYAFNQKVNLNKYDYVYDKQGALEKINKQVLNADMWGIPIFIAQTLEDMAIDPPAYQADPLNATDISFLASTKQRPLNPIGKCAGKIKQSTFQKVKSLGSSITVSVDSIGGQKQEDLVIMVPSGIRIARKTADNKLTNVAPAALKTGTTVEIWYEVHGYKRIAQLIFITE